jgi:transcriptional pleiotropic regulator of transition state genes
MKSTGITRKIDPLGRVVLPIELRRSLGIEETDPLEIFIDGDKIILHKYAPGCSNCGFIGTVAELGSIKLCAECLEKINGSVG